jgi:hypothetical protein
MRNDLHWWEWLTWTAREIQTAGYDPHQRFNKIGHRRPLSLRWSLSIGMWGLKSATEIMVAVSINPGEEQKNSERGTYDVFKHRHGLLAGGQFARHMNKFPKEERDVPPTGWDQFELARAVHLRARTIMSDPPIRHVINGDVIDMVRLRFRILPIEAYLYHQAVETVLEENMKTRMTWIHMEREDQRKLWDNALGPGQPMVVECPEELRYAHQRKKEQQREQDEAELH